MFLAASFSAPVLALDESDAIKTESTLVFSSPLKASSIKAESNVSQNRIEIFHKDFHLGYSNPNAFGIVKNYGVDANQGIDHAPWIDTQNYRITAWADMQVRSQWTLSAMLGVGQLDFQTFQGKTYNQGRLLPLGKLRSVYAPYSGTEIRLEASNDHAYQSWFDPQGRVRFLTRANGFAEIESFSFQSWQLRTNYSYTSFTDKNRQQVFDNLVMRDVFLSPFVLRLGAGGGFNRFRFNSDYWSPTDFWTVGPRMVVSKDFGGFWNAETRLGYDKHGDGNLDGQGVSGELHLNYKDRSGWRVSLNSHFVYADHGGWWNRDVGLNVEVPL